MKSSRLLSRWTDFVIIGVVVFVVQQAKTGQRRTYLQFQKETFHVTCCGCATLAAPQNIISYFLKQNSNSKQTTHSSCHTCAKHRKSLGYLDHFYLRGPPPRNFQILNPKLKVGISWNNIHVLPFHRERGTEGYPRRSKILNPKLKISQLRLNATWMQDDFQSSSDSIESLLFQQTAFQKPFISFKLSLKQLRLIFTTPIKGLHNSQRSCLDLDGLEYGSWSNACDTGPDSNTHG